jgi:hypothetical protein
VPEIEIEIILESVAVVQRPCSDFGATSFSRKEGELVYLDKVVDHETSPGNPSHVAIADEVHYKEVRLIKCVEALDRMITHSHSCRGSRGRR